ncbi:transporter substrate-binding domain-containing protein [Terasakiella sp. A23]|uniref:substrate-binding periplasmic protein n=1 Tax=Terasakiella sp. FCG-A23 TaxID=3080561 RepID=UPI0029533E98|nr:transporter substrate-binding domain-containing protein [Terasakiella sp. A23]MDV7340045.1 transporter substrate-binding domain-containing protein [Terasakiella sp. A23]
MIKQLLGMICIFSMICALPNSAQASEKVTVYTSYFPRVVVDNPGKPGFAYEIVSEIMKEAGLKFEIIALPWARAQAMAQTTPQSLIFPLSWTPTRAKSYDWSIKLFDHHTRFVTLNDIKLTPQSAHNMQIGVQLKSSYDNWLDEQGYKHVHRVPGEGRELIKLMQSNRVDAWYTDQIIADTVSSELKDLKFTYSQPVQRFSAYLATSRQAPYPRMGKIRAAMDKLQDAGLLTEIFAKYNLSNIH